MEEKARRDAVDALGLVGLDAGETLGLSAVACRVPLEETLLESELSDRNRLTGMAGVLTCSLSVQFARVTIPRMPRRPEWSAQSEQIPEEDMEGMTNRSSSRA